jgi:PTS system galactitol-specific IIB component
LRKKIIFVCATGVATSTVAAEKVAEYCKENGIDVESQQCNVASLPSLDESADLIISTTNVPYKLKTKVVNALPIITGFGEEELLDNVVKILKEE